MNRDLIGLFVCLASMAAAQQPAFEVASIKPSNYQGGPLRVTPRVGADGIDFSNVTPRLCIQRAYGLKPYQVVGPDWINTERYMIVAKAGRAHPEDQILRMLQTLLVERFKLAARRESKEMPVYALVVAKNGPKLKEATDEGATQIDAGQDGREVVFERVTMGALAGVVARSVDRPVMDATDLKGVYNFKLSWSDERPRPNAPGTEASETSKSDDAPSIFAALQQQLGLRLEARKAPVDILVIDRIERPSQN